MKNYKQTASDVLRLVGGEKNVVQVEHCSTRLRFTLADTSKVDAAALKKTAGVMGVISSGPQCQVVIGNDVIEVYDEPPRAKKRSAALFWTTWSASSSRWSPPLQVQAF